MTSGLLEPLLSGASKRGPKHGDLRSVVNGISYITRAGCPWRYPAKYKEGAAPAVRPTGARSMRFPKLGELRVHEHTGRLAKMLDRGRFHAYAASFRFEHGRWVVSVTGVAAEFHHQRRNTENRHQPRVGVDLGVKPSRWSPTRTDACCRRGRG